MLANSMGIASIPALPRPTEVMSVYRSSVSSLFLFITLRHFITPSKQMTQILKELTYILAPNKKEPGFSGSLFTLRSGRLLSGSTQLLTDLAVDLPYMTTPAESFA